ncbi:MAG: response regulator [Niastella sp.]|nr:response regulator [Niastella sp.]
MQKMIMLIDDDEEELLILDQAFQIAGLPYSCVWAGTLDRARQLLKEVLPDYIFIDYNMPKINGIECLEQVRREPGVDKVPIIMYSSDFSETVRLQALSKGAITCIQKTASLQMLTQYLRKILGETKLLHSLR